MHMPGENYRPTRLPEGADCILQVWENSEAATSKRGGSRVQEEFLHIDHKKRGFLSVKVHRVGVERSDVVQPFSPFS